MVNTGRLVNLNTLSNNLIVIIICSKSHFLRDVLALFRANSIFNWAQTKLANGLSAMLLLLSCIIVSYQIVISVCWSHALVNGPTSKMPASDGGMCIGQLLMMWAAVCSGSPH